MFVIKRLLPFVLLIFVAFSCNEDDAMGEVDSPTSTAELHAAFAEFDTDNLTILLDGDEVVIESNGLPNHTSPYWSNTTERTATMGNRTLATPAASENHPLFVAPTVTNYEGMAPGNIDDFNGNYTLRVPVSPSKAASSSATG